jgi:tetratricopeptide (TPR) repeat protein
MKRAAILAVLLLPACTTLHRQALQPQPAQNAALAVPAQSELYLGVVDGLIKQQRYQAAIAFLAKYQKSSPATPRFRILAGQALAGAGRLDEAIASYRGALQSASAAEGYNGIGKAEGARASWGEAAENFRRASELDPANADYLNNLGYAQLKQNLNRADRAQTLEVLQRAHELAPESARITANLALAMEQAGRRQQFLTLLDTIPDPASRRLVAEFAANWNPGPADNAPAKGYAP